MVELLGWFRVTVRKLINRCPRRIRVFLGPLLGGIIGLIGGIPGFLIGVLLGYLIRELFVQSFRDRRVIDYLENPGIQQFYEGEPGMAAWCALAVLVSSEDADIPAFPHGGSKATTPEKILRQVILGASCVFIKPAADSFLIEYFSRLAWLHKHSLNPDLLAESLAARRAYRGTKASQRDLKNLGRALYDLAGGEKARRLAREIRLILDPAFKDEKEPDNSGPGIHGNGDPWKILGLPPGTPPDEVKAHYRRLAKQFHPDELVVLDEQHRETAARAFMAIKEAYQEIMGKL